MIWVLVIGYCTLVYCDTFEEGLFKTEAACVTRFEVYQRRNEMAAPGTIMYNNFLCVKKPNNYKIKKET